MDTLKQQIDEEDDSEDFIGRYKALETAFQLQWQDIFNEDRENLLNDIQRQMSIDMEEFLLWPMIQRDKDGWRTSQKSSLIFSYQSYQSLQGFTINQKNGELELDLYEGNNPLFTLLDIDYILKGGIDRMFFSLDPPKDYPECNMHPCNQMRFGPWTLSDGDILQTLFHTDYLLKMFSVGVEIQGQYPYQMRSIYDGLMNRLPDDLKYALRPTCLRGTNQNKNSSLSRFWIESELIDIYEQNDNQGLKIKFGKVKMIVKQHIMKRNADGTLSDDKVQQTTQEKTADQQFANDFTMHYDRIAAYFPEFERLKEISKMLIISRSLKSFRNSLQQKGPSVKKIIDKVNEVYFDPIEEFNQEYIFSSQNKIRWVPAAYLSLQNQLGSVWCYGGVELNPNVSNIPEKLLKTYQKFFQNNPLQQSKSQENYLQFLNSVLEKAAQDNKSLVKTNQQIQSKPQIETLKGFNHDVKRVSKQKEDKKTQDQIIKEQRLIRDNKHHQQIIQTFKQVDKDIDLLFIIAHEKPKKEEDRLRGFIPLKKDKKTKTLIPVGESGVTVGYGYDIGQHSEKEVNELNVRDSLKKKLLPYTHIIKEDAQKLLKAKPLNITEDEFIELNKAIHPAFYKNFEKELRKYPGFYESLNSDQKTALYDFAFQQGYGALTTKLGEGLRKRDKELTFKLIEGFTKKTDMKSRNRDRIIKWKSGKK